MKNNINHIVNNSRKRGLFASVGGLFWKSKPEMKVDVRSGILRQIFLYVLFPDLKLSGSSSWFKQKTNVAVLKHGDHPDCEGPKVLSYLCVKWRKWAKPLLGTDIWVYKHALSSRSVAKTTLLCWPLTFHNEPIWRKQHKVGHSCSYCVVIIKYMTAVV